MLPLLAHMMILQRLVKRSLPSVQNFSCHPSGLTMSSKSPKTFHKHASTSTRIQAQGQPAEKRFRRRKQGGHGNSPHRHAHEASMGPNMDLPSLSYLGWNPTRQQTAETPTINHEHRMTCRRVTTSNLPARSEVVSQNTTILY